MATIQRASGRVSKRKRKRGPRRTTGERVTAASLAAVNDEEVEDEIIIRPPHPFKEQIDKCPVHDWQVKVAEPIPYRVLDITSCSLVINKKSLDDMVVKLKNVKEMGIVLKRESYRSFHGKSCFFQISTRDEEFIVDTLKLKSEVLFALYDIFTDVNILKVMWDAKTQLKWMQRDFGLYIVNMFDLFVACRAVSLDESTNSTRLNKLLIRHCSDQLDMSRSGYKNDWSARPLTGPNLQYMRTECHYLLHLYDKFRNALIAEGSLVKVYAECNTLCSFVWCPQDDMLWPNSYHKFQKERGIVLTEVESSVFRAVYDWRWKLAEEVNDCMNNVMPGRAVNELAKALPLDLNSMRDCLLVPFSPVVEGRIEELLGVIQTAIEGAKEAKRKKAENTCMKEREKFVQSMMDKYSNPSHNYTWTPPGTKPDMNNDNDKPDPGIAQPIPLRTNTRQLLELMEKRDQWVPQIDPLARGVVCPIVPGNKAFNYQERVSNQMSLLKNSYEKPSIPPVVKGASVSSVPSHKGGNSNTNSQRPMHWTQSNNYVL